MPDMAQDDNVEKLTEAMHIPPMDDMEVHLPLTADIWPEVGSQRWIIPLSTEQDNFLSRKSNVLYMFLFKERERASTPFQNRSVPP